MKKILAMLLCLCLILTAAAAMADGAIKISGFFGEYIEEKGDLTDHRQDGAYSDWNEELTEYDQLVEQMEGKSFYHVQQEQEEKKKEEKK